MTEKEWEDLNTFMVFPYMETLEGYEELLKRHGFEIIEKEDLSEDFAKHCHKYQNMLREELRPGIVENYNEELFNAADSGLAMWVDAADAHKVGRGCIIAKKI
jgi:hypothetical protein